MRFPAGRYSNPSSQYMDKSRKVKSRIDMRIVIMQGTAVFQKSQVKLATRSRATAGKFLLQGLRCYCAGLPSSHQVLSSAKAESPPSPRGKKCHQAPSPAGPVRSGSSRLLLRLDTRRTQKPRVAVSHECSFEDVPTHYPFHCFAACHLWQLGLWPADSSSHEPSDVYA